MNTTKQSTSCLVQVTIWLCGNETQTVHINLLLQFRESKSQQHALQMVGSNGRCMIWGKWTKTLRSTCMILLGTMLPAVFIM